MFLAWMLIAVEHIREVRVASLLIYSFLLLAIVCCHYFSGRTTCLSCTHNLSSHQLAVPSVCLHVLFLLAFEYHFLFFCLLLGQFLLGFEGSRRLVRGSANISLASDPRQRLVLPKLTRQILVVDDLSSSHSCWVSNRTTPVPLPRKTLNLSLDSFVNEMLILDLLCRGALVAIACCLWLLALVNLRIGLGIEVVCLELLTRVEVVEVGRVFVH